MGKQAEKKVEPVPIALRLGDGSVVSGTSGVTTPNDILGSEIVVARVGTEEWDCARPFAESCEVEGFTFDTPVGQAAFWHSAAHVLGSALEVVYGASTAPSSLPSFPLLCDGPPGPSGFFYELWLPGGASVPEGDLPKIQKAAKKIAKRKHRFQRLQVSRATAAAMFSYNRFKMDMLRRIPEGEPITLYRCGDFIDLCRGPHLPHTGVFHSGGGLRLLRASGSQTTLRTPPPSADGDEATEASVETASEETVVRLQRVHGIAFPRKQQLEEWEAAQAEARRRDHRLLARQQQLVMFHDMSPGSAFLLPHGTRIYNTLLRFMRQQYRKRGYEEVRSPLMYKRALWEQSGHWQHYGEDMYRVTPGTAAAPVTSSANDATATAHGGGGGGGCCDPGSGDQAPEEEEFGLKPMNCPGHCLIFASQTRSYRDLPLRMADFSALHRNELSGALSGLTRVRRFSQDDAHIFCTPEQVGSEIAATLSFVREVYGVFGFAFHCKFSTQPEDSGGSQEMWAAAEAALSSALAASGLEWEENAGDGAFYGPKIDIEVTDAIGRKHQCATVQLDFLLPQRFHLKYSGADGKEHTPVMIHRAILGSVERMMAILMEHTAGKWPLWLSPRQVLVLPVGPSNVHYASSIVDTLHDQGYHVDLDSSSRSLPKRVRAGQLAQYNYCLVVGDEEEGAGSVNIRSRDGARLGTTPLAHFSRRLQQEVASYGSAGGGDCAGGDCAIAGDGDTSGGGTTSGSGSGSGGGATL